MYRRSPHAGLAAGGYDYTQFTGGGTWVNDTNNTDSATRLRADGSFGWGYDYPVFRQGAWYVDAATGAATLCDGEDSASDTGDEGYID